MAIVVKYVLPVILAAVGSMIGIYAFNKFLAAPPAPK